MSGRERRNATETRFLNVDLDLVAKADLTPLLETFGDSVVVLRNTVERRVHTLWLEHSPEPRHVDHAFMQYAKLVRRLPRTQRKLWNDCRSRCLNIGIQSAAEPHAQCFDLSEEAVLAAGELGASIVITVYGSGAKGRPSRSLKRNAG